MAVAVQSHLTNRGVPPRLGRAKLIEAARPASKRSRIKRSGDEGLQQNANVEAERPMSDVLEVEGHPGRHPLDVRGGAAKAGNLRQTADPRPRQESRVVVFDCGAVELVMRQGMGPWAHQRHIAFENVQKLRQLVDARTPEEEPKPRQASVALAGLKDLWTIFK